MSRLWSVSLCVVLQGKGMLLVLQDRMLTLVDPDDRSLLHSQPINNIRVWGVGRDHDRSVAIAFVKHTFICFISASGNQGFELTI